MKYNMNQKITRLKFKDLNRSFEAKGFKVFWNTSEYENTLDVAVHAQNDGLSLHYTVNGSALLPVPKDSIRKKLENETPEFIYQFSVPFSDLKAKANIIAISEKEGTYVIGNIEFFAETEDAFKRIQLERPGVDSTDDQALWDVIQKNSLKFQDYTGFIDKILCQGDNLTVKGKTFRRGNAKRRTPFIKSEEYSLIKFATEFYMMAKLGLDTSTLSSYAPNNMLPYFELIQEVLDDEIDFHSGSGVSDCEERENDRLTPVLIELIWNYWMEQGMLVQTLNVINLRFQNIKGNNYSDRLQRFDADPLRPLSHILWGYIQDEQHRLSIPRRLNEYDHEYGLTLTGRAVPRINPVDTRVKFLEAFHSLLTLCTIYFKESDDTTRIADAFPILNSLKEVHLLLAEGNHNAYGNLTWTARQEMLMQQYILSRPEMREFLGGRVMVPYPEKWMDRVDTMRNIQGWGGTGIVHFYELAVHGEMILLSIRYGNWSDVSLDRSNAANWAQQFRNSIQRYIHAYRAVTGIDMSVDQIVQLPSNFAVQPAYLIQQRLISERARTRRA